MLLNNKLHKNVSSLTISAFFLGGVSTSCLAVDDKSERASLTNTVAAAKSQTESIEVEESSENMTSQVVNLTGAEEHSLLEIFSNLHIKEFSNLRLVSKQWNAIVQNVCSSYITSIGWKPPSQPELHPPIVIAAFSLSTINEVIKLITDESILEHFVSHGFDAAIEKKITVLTKRGFGSRKDLKAAQKLNAAQVKKRELSEVDRKLEDIPEQKSHDILTRKNHIDAQVVRGNPEAIKKKFEGLLYGWHGYRRNQVGAKTFLENLFKNGNPTAVKIKIYSLTNGGNGYARNPETAREIIEDQAQKGNAYAIQRKVIGLITGRYGYNQDPTFTNSYVDMLHKLHGN